jgi:hypothetical protein
MVTRRWALAGLLGLTSLACFSRQTRSAGSPDLITGAEIYGTSASNAYDVINRLRPQWLRTQRTGAMSAGVRNQVIAVYVDGVRLGDLAVLRSVNAAGLESMEYLDAIKAATVLRDPANQSVAGAIVIKTIRRNQ